MSRAAVRLVLAVWVAGLLVGTVAHLGDLVAEGPFAHREFAPAWLDLYWSSLAVVDPLAAVLLLRGRRVGVDLLLAVLATDLAANAYAVLVLLDGRPTESGGLGRLLAFGLFVLVTAPWVRRAFGPAAAPAG
ncbi:hypothetical protein ABZ135_35815 [Streptomyces sp. NPDC006339]|uniref:hypothetical protein n=1 Tax=Streptomyces sp. NPDC006339 TaxID=3156755 RepID=UPI0033AFFB68